jgi:hypothetical protein
VRQSQAPCALICALAPMIGIKEHRNQRVDLAASGPISRRIKFLPKMAFTIYLPLTISGHDFPRDDLA